MNNKIFISIVGKSNVGKSTLINYLCDSYISSESNKPQTTTANLYTETLIKNLRFVFIDTPGLSVKGNDLLSVAMKNSYIKSFEGIDLVIILTDINKSKKFENDILNILKPSQVKILVVVNKIDLFKEDLTLYKEFQKSIKNSFKEKVFFISLHSNKGLKNFIKEGILEKAHDLNQKNKFSINETKNEIVLIQELIRGVIVNNTHKEIPYDAAVKVNKYEKSRTINKIDASIYVNKINQRKIIIGSNGNLIKLIGSKSRNILESKYKKDFYLKLNVCVKKNWKNNHSFLRNIGYIS